MFCMYVFFFGWSACERTPHAARPLPSILVPSHLNPMAVVPSPIHPRHSSPFRKAQDTSRLSTTTTAHGPSSGASSEHYPDIFQAFLLSIPAPSHPCPPMAAVSDPVPPGHPSPFRKAQKFSGPSATTTAHGLSLVGTPHPNLIVTFLTPSNVGFR
jgi:hypothetical protein